jgi:hypothetical protein
MKIGFDKLNLCGVILGIGDGEDSFDFLRILYISNMRRFISNNKKQHSGVSFSSPGFFPGGFYTIDLFYFLLYIIHSTIALWCFGDALNHHQKNFAEGKTI